MSLFDRIQRRLAVALLLTALIPMLSAIGLVQSAIRRTAERFFVPEIAAHLDESLGLYQELARTVKSLMREQLTNIALRPALRNAVREKNQQKAEAALSGLLGEFKNLVSLSVHDQAGEVWARAERLLPVDPARENTLELSGALSDLGDTGPELVAVFAADKARFDGLSEMSQFIDTYKQIEARRLADERSYVLGFAALLGITILASVSVGTALARGVTGRMGDLARATRQVAAGDLLIRVPVRGNDEVSDLGRAFNRMLDEVGESRARAEYLQRIAAWQQMARRLAHEIKNPLTPIQLAVQEVHRRCPEGDPAFRKLMNTTLEVVEDEVGTLRRLVTEFSDFARLPEAKLEPYDLCEFVREQARRLGLQEDDTSGAVDLADGLAPNGHKWELETRIEVPRADVLLDRQMLRRVLVNLTQNAAQATAERTAVPARIRITVSKKGSDYVLDVEDNGPGIDTELAQRVFDPYVTTKADGTGLGLAIAKKIVIEHRGTVQALKSELGGACMRVTLPALQSSAPVPPVLAMSGKENHEQA